MERFLCIFFFVRKNLYILHYLCVLACRQVLRSNNVYLISMTGFADAAPIVAVVKMVPIKNYENCFIFFSFV